MSKFKVGDKVWCNGDVKIIKRVDEWEDGEYGYYFNVDDDLLDFWREEDLELYKTPHERLLELGWVSLNKANGVSTYLLNVDGRPDPEIIELYTEEKRYYTTLRIIDLELAEILVDYLEELEKWKDYGK